MASLPLVCASVTYSTMCTQNNGFLQAGSTRFFSFSLSSTRSKPQTTVGNGRAITKRNYGGHHPSYLFNVHLSALRKFTLRCRSSCGKEKTGYPHRCRRGASGSYYSKPD